MFRWRHGGDLSRHRQHVGERVHPYICTLLAMPRLPLRRAQPHRSPRQRARHRRPHILLRWLIVYISITIFKLYAGSWLAANVCWHRKVCTIKNLVQNCEPLYSLDVIMSVEHCRHASTTLTLKPIRCIARSTQ